MQADVEVITGPTASGKTSLALARAVQNASIEIVNADAFQIYKGFDIGTAKPTSDIRDHIPHHLIDILAPSERFSAADYSDKTRNSIRDILSRGKTPLVVGGTGFYIDALFYGLSPNDIAEEVLAKARDRYQVDLKSLGYEKMFWNLLNIDPVLHQQIERERNPIRLERAWSHYYATGIPLGVAREQKPEPFEHKPVFTRLEIPRGELHKRIELRIDEMLAANWLEEVRDLLAGGITLDAPAMRAIGYAELAGVVQGKTGLEEARKKIIIRTRQYAKRQVTWMKRYKK